MNLIAKIQAIWQGVSLVQRVLLVAIALTFVLVGGLLLSWASRPDMRLLYSDLSPDDASKVTEKISEKDIKYELRGSGTTIYVPREHVSELRLEMAREGLPTGGQIGHSWLDTGKIGDSPVIQDLKRKRGMEEELAKTIQIIDGVVFARVHIVSAEQTLFGSDSDNTSASVVLRMQPGYRLSNLNIASITHLVSSSVQGLGTKNVTVVDSQGNLLSSGSDSGMATGADTVQDYRERVEKSLAGTVEDLLTAALGPGRAKVKVSAVIDMNSVSTITEEYDPTKKVAKKEEITTGTKPVASGGAAGGAGGVEKDETILTDYEVGRVVRQETVLPGAVRSLSVAAMVDLSVEDANDVGGAQAATIVPLSDVEEIIVKALGLNDTSNVKVIDVKFNRAKSPLAMDEGGGGLSEYMGIARQASMGTMAVCALLFVKVLGGPKGNKVKGKKGKTKKFKKGKGGNAAALPASETAGLLEGETVEDSTMIMQQQIAEALQSDPARVKQLFTSWVEQQE